ncbi:hypothetical protein B0T26DRAFT_143106 [Lasiosphaeria miniovina]|uniref:Uncharacterized protein n=1 Tax=Lasiosphaeria miniovina TaxID=1954250 RepID=A0AA40B4U8_9PEZI|nr:uncharacterized protein B0T26DRAFT_143106 [Lasiosphaeria miniovina]KAK0727711.1 hypothetical protein B0T26DRAFT_143106 [Lasiosphaeria miniovina]
MFRQSDRTCFFFFATGYSVPSATYLPYLHDDEKTPPFVLSPTLKWPGACEYEAFPFHGRHHQVNPTVPSWSFPNSQLWVPNSQFLSLHCSRAMRLINMYTLKLAGPFLTAELPPHAILSLTWSPDGLCHQDVADISRQRHRRGHAKIKRSVGGSERWLHLRLGRHGVHLRTFAHQDGGS